MVTGELEHRGRTDRWSEGVMKEGIIVKEEGGVGRM